jgi:uncharacterized protein (TIGR02246 family)
MKPWWALLASVVAVKAAAADTISRADLAEAAKAIAAADADWVLALKAHDADRVAAPYAANGLFVLGSGKVIVGRAAIADLMRARFKAVKVTGGTIHELGLRAADGVVIEWGEAGVTMTKAQGLSHTSAGLYLTVWKKSAAGRWEIIRNLTF